MNHQDEDDYNPSGTSGSNALMLPSKKTSSNKEVVKTVVKKAKPLSANRRKKLEKKNQKREKVINREAILEELKQYQLTDKQRGMMVPVTASSKKMKS